MARQISQRAFDMTVAQEVTSKAFYEKHYQRPEWPGLQSGPTVGIGYDLGQADRSKIKRDWEGLVSSDMLLVMMGCSGYVGMAGKAKTAEVRDKITIGWAAALTVFQTRDVPTWTAGVLQYIPGAEKLPPSCLGVLFDLAYNRGHSWNNGGDRYTEMRMIKKLVSEGNFALVPEQIRSMKRLWPNTVGLLRRCDDRVALWQYGLRNETADTPGIGAVATGPDPKVPTQAGPARTKPPTTTKAQNTTAVVVAAGTAGAAQQAHALGIASASTAIALAVLGCVVAGVIWYAWHRSRNPD